MAKITNKKPPVISAVTDYPIEIDFKSMGSRLKGERNRLHYTQEHVAEAIGITPAFVGHIERGERSLSLDTLIRLCNFYHVTIDYVMHDILPSDSDVIIERISSLLHNKTESQQTMIYDVLNTLVRHM